MNEAGTIGVKDNKLTGSEITKFLVYVRENYVEKFSQAFSDISENRKAATVGFSLLGERNVEAQQALYCICHDGCNFSADRSNYA